MIRAGLGQSEHTDTVTAVDKAIQQCLNGLEDAPPQAGIVLASGVFDYDLMLKEIAHQFPGIDLIGCTTAGDFSSRFGFSDDSITLLLFHSDTVQIGTGVARSLKKDADKAIGEAVQQATEQMSMPLSICITLPDGHDITFDPIMETLNRELGGSCPIFGGAAGTQWVEGTPPLQFYRDEVLTDSMPLMLFGGPLDYSFSIANSWQPVGKKARITEASGRQIFRIDNFSAVDFYRYYLGDHAEPAREFLLAVYEPGDEHFYLRAPISYHPDGSITFSETIPTGAKIQLTEAIRDVMVSDTESTTDKLVNQSPDLNPAFAMAFSCAFRKDMLGTQVGQELEILMKKFKFQLPIIGFYSFGEIAPLVKGQESYAHGATLVTLVVGQSDTKTAGRTESIDKSQSHPKMELEPEAPPVKPGIETFKQENELLARKLNRSEKYRERTEQIKDFMSRMHRKIIQEVEQGRREIQRKEAQLRKSEEKYRRIVTTAAEGFVLMDDHMRIIDLNEAYCRMTGYHRDELLDRNPFGLLTKDSGAAMAAFKDKIQSAAYSRFEDVHVAKDGRRIPLLIHASRLTDDSGATIGNMAFVTDLTEQKKALALAAEVQRSLLPQDGIHLPGIDIAGRNLSCDEIGGDYFDFLEQKDYPEAPISIVVGDIVGHGVDAALFMTTARAFLRMRASQAGDISDIITAMNRHLTLDVLDSGRFMTLFYLAIDPVSSRLQWVRAGHDPALVYDPNRNRFDELSGSGIALGINADFRYQQFRQTGLAEGQIIALGTDGIWEAFNRDGRMFGKERFRDVIRRHADANASDIVGAVYSELDEFTQGMAYADDITLVVAKFG